MTNLIFDVFRLCSFSAPLVDTEEIWQSSCDVEWWFSSLNIYQNHLECLFNRFLSLMSKVLSCMSGSGPPICISVNDADGSGPGTTV